MVNRKGLHIEIVTGAAGYEVVVGFVRDFDACFRIGMLGAKGDRVCAGVRRKGGHLTIVQDSIAISFRCAGMG